MLQGIRSRVALLTPLWLGVVTGAARHAAAEPAALTTLEVSRSSAAETCIDSASLTRSVEARLARRAFAESAPRHLRVSLDRRGSAWLAELALTDRAGPLGERSLSSNAPHCSALDDSLALVVALLVDTPPERSRPERVTPDAATAGSLQGKSETEPPRAPEPRKALRPGSTPLIVPANTWAPRAPFQFAGRAGASLLLLGLPGVAYGPALGAAARPPGGPWLRLHADVALPKDRRSTDRARGVRVSSERLGLFVCGLSLGTAKLEGQFCAGQRVGRITAEGLGFDHSQQVHRLYFAASLGIELSTRLTDRWYLPVGLFAELPLTRDEFVARDRSEPLHRVGAVAGAVSAALEFRGGS